MVMQTTRHPVWLDDCQYRSIYPKVARPQGLSFDFNVLVRKGGAGSRPTPAHGVSFLFDFFLRTNIISRKECTQFRACSGRGWKGAGRDAYKRGVHAES